MVDKVWKDVPGYEGLYQANRKGEVRSIPRRGTDGRILKPDVTRSGYHQVTLYRNGVPCRYKVHRLVLLTFHGMSDLDTNHINGDKGDNRLGNLEYVTPKENTAHALKLNGAWQSRGQNHPASKITREQAREILRLKAKMTQREIADTFGLSEAQVSRIVNGKRWNHVRND